MIVSLALCDKALPSSDCHNNTAVHLLTGDAVQLIHLHSTGHLDSADGRSLPFWQWRLEQYPTILEATDGDCDHQL